MIFNDVLEEEINKKNKCIGKDVGIEEEYYIYRSVQWVYTTQARNKGVSDLNIPNYNICINDDITGGCSATTNMLEYYSQIKMLLPKFLGCYQAL